MDLRLSAVKTFSLFVICIVFEKSCKMFDEYRVLQKNIELLKNLRISLEHPVFWKVHNSVEQPVFWKVRNSVEHPVFWKVHNSVEHPVNWQFLWSKS